MIKCLYYKLATYCSSVMRCYLKALVCAIGDLENITLSAFFCSNSILWHWVPHAESA